MINDVSAGTEIFSGRGSYEKVDATTHPELYNSTKVTIEKLLDWEEGYRRAPYYCSEGYVTYGIGHRLSDVKDEPLDNYANLWITRRDAESLLTKDLFSNIDDIASSNFVVYYDELSNDRQIIIESMVYQMGAAGVAKFMNMWVDISKGDFNGAADEMLDSLWAKQTPKRAKRHAEVMRTSDLKFTYGGYLS